MGLRTVLRLYKYSDTESFRETMNRAADRLGGSIVWGQPGLGDRDLRIAHGREVQTVYIPYQKRDWEFCNRLGEALVVPWLELRAQEGSIWDYSLMIGSTPVHDFSVCPQYWEGETTSVEVMESYRGNPLELAGVWGLPLEKIERYLVNWGYDADPGADTFEYRLKGKAYPSDQFENGDCYQVFDFLTAMGGREPDKQHSITLPC